MDYSISRRFTRFQNFLKETLPKSLHGSGTLTSGPSDTPSRKNSLTSLTHYLLFPKSRSLSTNSLPNLRTNAVIHRPLGDNDLTKATFIGGIPVLTKHGKVVCYQDPMRDYYKKRPTSNVYYPDPSRSQVDKPSKKSSKNKEPEIEVQMDSGETSGLLSSELETSENWQGSQESTIWKRSSSQAEPDIVIHVQDVEEVGEHAARCNHVSSESGFEEGEEAMFVTVAEVECRDSAPKAANAEPSQVPHISPSPRRTSAPPLPSSPELRRQSTEESQPDFYFRSFSDDTQRFELAVSPVSKSPSDGCIGPVAQSLVPKSSSDPNLKKPHPKSFRRHILKRLFSKTKPKDKATSAGVNGEDRSRSASVSPPDVDDKTVKTQDYLSPLGVGDQPLRSFAKAASDTCLDRSELTSQKDRINSFKVKEKRKKSKSERIKRKKHTADSESPVLEEDVFVAEDAFGYKKSYSVKVRVRRLPSVERLDPVSSDMARSGLSDSLQKKKHKKKPKVANEEVVLEMEEIPRCKTVGELEFQQGSILASSTFAKAVAVTNDTGTRVGFYVPEPEDIPLPPPSLYRCASDPCLTFKKVEEKAMKRRETKRRKRHGRQARARRYPGVSIRIVDEDRQRQTQSHSSKLSKSGHHKKKTNVENKLLLSVHQPLFRTKSDPPHNSSSGEQGGDAARLHTFPSSLPPEKEVPEFTSFAECDGLGTRSLGSSPLTATKCSHQSPDRALSNMTFKNDDTVQQSQLSLNAENKTKDSVSPIENMVSSIEMDQSEDNELTESSLERKSGVRPMDVSSVATGGGDTDSSGSDDASVAAETRSLDLADEKNISSSHLRNSSTSPHRKVGFRGLQMDGETKDSDTAFVIC